MPGATLNKAKRKRRHLKTDNRKMMNSLHIFGPLNTAATFFIALQ
jgi:hypothetical protein